jgi:hypothetical protein
MFLGLPDSDLLERGTDPVPDPSGFPLAKEAYYSLLFSLCSL